MAIAVTRQTLTNQVPIWQGSGKDIQLAQGGFALSATGLPINTVIPAGTPVVFDEAARTASIVGGGTLQATASSSATTYRVNKGHTFKVGDYLSAVIGGTAYAITAIDTTNTAYDTLTVGTTLGVGYSAGQNLFVSSATGATASAYAAINGLLYDDTFGNAGESISVVIKGTVYARRIPFAYNASLAAIAALSHIIFSQSK